MDAKWNQVISSQTLLNDKTDDQPDKIKSENDKNDKMDSKTDTFNDSYEKQHYGPDSPMYLPQYEKSYSLKANLSKVEKRYKYNPKPLGKKTNRSFVPEDKKTEEYWQKRIKNNVAARKSREDRRRKEIEMLSKRSAYEKENLQLRLFIEKMQSENQYLLYEINFLREGKVYPKF